MRSEFYNSVDSVTFGGMTARLLLGGETAAATVIDMTISQGGGAPRHQSLDEEKLFTLIDGVLEFTLEETTRTLLPGSCVSVSRGAAHGFVNKVDTAARLFLVSTPSRHDAFFRAMAAIPLPHDPNIVRKVCATYRQVIIGM